MHSLAIVLAMQWCEPPVIALPALLSFLALVCILSEISHSAVLPLEVSTGWKLGSQPPPSAFISNMLAAI
jgi:hypothetical protein